MKAPLRASRLSSVLLLAALLPACGSSDSKQQQAPGDSGELPAEFAIFFSDRDPSGNPLVTGEVPHLYDFATGELTSVASALFATRPLLPNSASLSPDGRYLFATVGDVGSLELHAIDLQERTSRRVALPSNLESGPRAGDEGQAIVAFSTDSSRTMILAPSSISFQRATYVADAYGGALRRIVIDDDEVEPVTWLGDSARLLVAGYDSVLESEVLAVVDSSGTLGPLIAPAPGGETSIDYISVSRDGSVVAIVANVYLSNGTEYYRLVTIDLETSVRTEFTIPGLEDAYCFTSDNGDFVAVLANDPSPSGSALWIADVASGLVEGATLPNAHGGVIGMNDELVAWEPGGRRLAFVSNHRDSSTDEITIAEFGAAPYAIEPSVIPNSFVDRSSWSPAGRFLAYETDVAYREVLVFDADSVAAPRRLTDTTFAMEEDDSFWSQDGSRLLTRVEPVTQTIARVDSARQVVAYSVPDFSRLGTLGPAWTTGDFQDPNFLNGRAAVAFSRDGQKMLWRAEPVFGEPDQLLSATIDTVTGLPEDIAAGAPAGTAPSIEQFWLRR
ncbi:WD40 repeat domain-containing protein [Planctomycetes bacterium Poly30]